MLPLKRKRRDAKPVSLMEVPEAPPTSDRYFVRAEDGESVVITTVQAGSTDLDRIARVIGASRGELRRYQLDGVHFLVKQKRAILADEQGVGKTVQALIAARHLVPRSSGRILIVAPKSASGVWQYETQKWLGEEAKSYQGTTRAWDDLDNAPIVITNYSLLKEVFTRQPHWTLMIFDEAHKLRGWRPASSKKGTYRALGKGSSLYKFFLTGTPYFTNAGDIWPLLHQIDPQKFNSYWSFLSRWTHLERGPFGYQIMGNRQPKLLREGLKKQGYMLRRLKKDVMPELPPKTRMEWVLEMTPKQRRDYEKLAKDMIIELNESQTLAAPTKLAVIVRLRQLLVSPRLLGLDSDGAALEALKEELSESNDAAIVFTPFPTLGLPILQQTLKSSGREIFIVHKELNPKQLAKVVDDFQHASGNREPVLISSLLLGTSWTATRATLAYFLGYDWSPSNNFQAEDRLHRHGQQYATTIKYAMHRGTVDEHVMDILSGKLSIQRALLDPKRFLLPEVA
jgi:SNF2 family DNA or RNA helicase